MNLFQEIKAIFTVKSVTENVIKEAQMPSTSGKPGYLTSEFWLNVVTQVGTLWGAVSGFIPPKYAAIISTSGIALYTVARTVAKAVADIQAAKATSTTVTTTQPTTVVTSPAA